MKRTTDVDFDRWESSYVFINVLEETETQGVDGPMLCSTFDRLVLVLLSRKLLKRIRRLIRVIEMGVNVLKGQEIKAQVGVTNLPSSFKTLLPIGLSRSSHT
jgi:hypothetical protein